MTRDIVLALVLLSTGGAALAASRAESGSRTAVTDAGAPESRALLERHARLAGANAPAVEVSAGVKSEQSEQPSRPRPNILWITCEDMSPNLGCYGDPEAHTPNLDRFALESTRYTRAFATAPVCSPARSCLITGLYATSLGTHNLRAAFPIPKELRGFPSYLREEGYFCTNNSKTDYNTSSEPELIAQSWDESGPSAHWRHRSPGQPFFSVFNLMETHQSRSSVWSFGQFEEEIGRRLKKEQRQDPETVPLPPYYPDTPLVRRTMARYYDCIAAMDLEVGDLLRQLKEDGLAENTIVFFYSDHGMGMPRGKRTLYDSGLQVPLLIRFPKAYNALAGAEPGKTIDQLVSFVDFPPTVLSLIGIDIPDEWQGRPFLGPAKGAPRRYVYGARDRVDEAYETSRSVRDARWLYIRNYRPFLSWNQPEGFSDNAAMRRQIAQMAEQGRLNSVQMAYAGPQKALEELYDTSADPHQIHNLADSPVYADVLARLREEHRRWSQSTGDLGFLPEWEIARRSTDRTPWDVAQDSAAYPVQRVLQAAEAVGHPLPTGESGRRMKNPEAAVRYWTILALRAAGAEAPEHRDQLAVAMRDASAPVRIEAARALAERENPSAALSVLRRELNGDSLLSVLHAARALQELGEKARPVLEAMKATLATAQSREEEEPHFLYIRFALEPAVQSLEHSRP